METASPRNSWRGIREADGFGPACPQMSRMTLARKGPALPSNEDCLTLNVWRPAGHHAAGKLQVMVWIYGGAFIGGAAREPVYDGAALARHNVIVVSFNYRVGRLGFFAHPALTATAETNELLGNYGLMDQIAALLHPPS